MGLTPAGFWSLTPREFTLKHSAFIRAEDRAESAAIRQALRVGSFKDNDRRALWQTANALKRYPVRER